MIERFEVGKWYRWMGPKERPSSWIGQGIMNEMLDGLPHRCTTVHPVCGSFAAFEDIPNRIDIDDPTWAWGNLSRFEEVEAPKPVDTRPTWEEVRKEIFAAWNYSYAATRQADLEDVRAALLKLGMIKE